MQRGRTGNRAREIAWGDFDGQETVGNSLGRAPWEGSEHVAWTDKKPWKYSLGLHWEGASMQRGRRKP